MLVRILHGKDLFYPGELVSMDDVQAKWYIKGGYAEEAKDFCPECNSLLMHQGGCVNCGACGWSKCG